MTPAPEDLKILESVAKSEGSRLNPEDRFDLRQELALKLLSRHARPENLRAWAIACANHWVANFVRNEKLHAELLKEYRAFGTQRPYRKGENWRPSWYEPHKDAREFSPLSCEGARLMHCKSTLSLTDVEEVFAQYLDSKGVWRKAR